MDRLPPHNQRKLNWKLAEIYGEKYADWYELAKELQDKGSTYTDISDHFKALGINVGVVTVYNWMRERKRQSSRSAKTQAA